MSATYGPSRAANASCAETTSSTVERLELVDALEPDVLLGDGELELLAQDLRVEQVLDADADPRGLVRVGRPDAPAGRPDLEPTQASLARAVERHVPRHDEVGVAGNEQQALRLVPARLELVELRDQNAGIDDAAGADRAALARDDAGRDLPDLVGLVAHDDGVAGVRSTLVAADEIRVLREQVDDLSLPLVAPLRADDDGRGHARQSCTGGGQSPEVARASLDSSVLEVSTLDTAGIPEAAHGLSAPARSPTMTSGAPPSRRTRASSGSAAAVATPPTTNAEPTLRASPSAPSPIWPPTPPAFDTIESKETTVARCSEGTTWCRYADRTGLVTPSDPVTRSSAGTATQNEPVRPRTTAATDCTAAAARRSVERRPQ